MKVTEGQYFISEIFRSIQGEGPFAGVNSLFIRFQFCQLTCNWCDTKYTWYQKSGKFSLYSEKELQKIIHESPARHIIFTGGEPTLYRLDKLRVKEKLFHVETNGDIIPTLPLQITLADGTVIEREAMKNDILKQFYWIVSPKLKNAYQLINKEKLDFWAKQTQAYFKFIIRSNEDLEEIAYWKNSCNINPDKIYVGLEGISLHSQLQSPLVEEIIARGYHFSPRLHIMIWGNMRGK